MPAEVTLTSAARNALLALRRTTSLIQISQRRVSSGLRTARAADDPDAFFNARSLRVRAADFQRRKDSIDQGVSAAEAGLAAADSIKSLIDQLQSVSASLRTAADEEETADLVRQFNTLRTQINNLAADATYQGVNLVNGGDQALRVEISEQGDGFLRVSPADLTSSGTGVNRLIAAVTGNSVIEVRASTGTIASGGIALRAGQVGARNSVGRVRLSYNFTYEGPDDTIAAGLYEIQYGEKTLTFKVEPGGSFALTQGRVFNIGVTSSVGSSRKRVRGTFAAASVVRADLTVTPRTRLVLEGSDPEITADYVFAGASDAIDRAADRLDAAENTVRAAARRLGTNVDLLKTRLDFTEEYVKTLEEGADKLTAADLNDEQALLTALQTRQRLSVSSLSAAAQSERGILTLIRQALEQGESGTPWFRAASLLEDGAGAG